MRTMADEIKRAFRATGWTLKRMSQESVTRYATVHEFFTGGKRMPTLDTIQKWCKALRLELRPRKR